MGQDQVILPSQHILKEDELRAIGHVAAETTYCEHAVEQIIWALCNLEEDQGKFFTHQMGLKARLELVSDLWKPFLRGARLDKFTKLISDLKEANEERNTIIHGYWHWPKLSVREFMYENKSFPPATAKKRRLRKEPLEFSATRIRQTAERMYLLTTDLEQLADDEGLLT